MFDCFASTLIHGYDTEFMQAIAHNNNQRHKNVFFMILI